MVTFANLCSVRLPNLKFVGLRVRKVYGAFSVSAVYLQQFPSYSNHNCKNSSFLRTPAFIFCLPWGRPCVNHAKRCMNEKTIQCLPNPSQHVPIYLEHFPSYSNCFHVPQPTFLFLLETPLRLSRNMLHGWKDNKMHVKPFAARTHLSSTVSRLFEPQVQKIAVFTYHWGYHAKIFNVVPMEREFDAYKCLAASNYNRF